MKIQRNVFITGLVAAGAISYSLAQTDLSTSSYAPAVASSSSVVAPRTGIYTGTTMGNAAADNTVDNYTKRPTLIQGKQYFAGWGGADLANGAYSFNAIGFDWFGSVVSTAGGSGNVHAGIANSKWGGGLIIDFNKASGTTAGNTTKTVIDGDGFGLFGDFNLGSSDAYGEVGYFTGPGNYLKTEVPPAETKPATIHLMGGWKKDATTEGTHALNAEVSVNLSSIEATGGTPAATVKASSTSVTANFYHGYILKATNSYSVFLGETSSFNFEKTDNPAPTADPDHTGLSVMPNLAFQKQLGKGFEVSAGASAGLSYDRYSNMPAPPLLGTPSEATKLLTAQANVQLGLRWVKDNFAVEGSFNEALLQRGPYFISGGAAALPMYAQVGVSLGI